MRKILTVVLLFLVLPVYAQRYEPRIGISFGTTLGTYTGADFGSAYSMSFYTSNYNDRYYYNSYYYDNSYNSFLSPLEFDLGLDVGITRNISLSFESSFIWHINGRPHRDYVTYISGSRSYLERWDNSYMYAVPLFLSLKLYPFGKETNSFYLSAGYGMQYTTESMDRLREDLDYNHHNYYGRTYVVGSISEAKWLQGIKLAIGLNFPFADYVSNETEIKFTNFFPQRNIYSSLAMNTTTNITFIGISTKMYFNF